MTPSPRISSSTAPAASRMRQCRARSCTDLSGFFSPSAFCSAVDSSDMRMLREAGRHFQIGLRHCPHRAAEKPAGVPRYRQTDWGWHIKY